MIHREPGNPPEIRMEVFEPKTPLEVGAGFIKNAPGCLSGL